MASCTVSVGPTGSAKLPSKQSRRVLHRPVSPYEREKSPVPQLACTMDGTQLQCDNSEIKSLLISIQELAQKKHILNPVYLLYSDACKIYSAVVEGCNPPRGICDRKDGETKLQIYSLVFETVQCMIYWCLICYAAAYGPSITSVIIRPPACIEFTMYLYPAGHCW